MACLCTACWLMLGMMIKDIFILVRFIFIYNRIRVIRDGPFSILSNINCASISSFLCQAFLGIRTLLFSETLQFVRDFRGGKQFLHLIFGKNRKLAIFHQKLYKIGPQCFCIFLNIRSSEFVNLLIFFS